eukprot:Skav216525  [mRNA]  locus=scaffold1003:224076:224674:+ [translate_table: standard]
MFRQRTYLEESTPDEKKNWGPGGGLLSLASIGQGAVLEACLASQITGMDVCVAKDDGWFELRSLRPSMAARSTTDLAWPSSLPSWNWVKQSVELTGLTDESMLIRND